MLPADRPRARWRGCSRGPRVISTPSCSRPRMCMSILREPMLQPPGMATRASPSARRADPGRRSRRASERPVRTGARARRWVASTRAWTVTRARRAKPADHLGHDVDVGDLGTLVIRARRGHKCGGHELERGVLGALDAHVSGERRAAANDDRVHGLSLAQACGGTCRHATVRAGMAVPGGPGRTRRSAVARPLRAVRVVTWRSAS